LAASIPSISSGDVSNLAKIQATPFWWNSTAFSAVKTNFPTAAPGEAPRPFPKTTAFFLASGQI